MKGMEEFFKKAFKEDPNAYEEFLENQKKWQEEFEKKDQSERQQISDLFLAPTREEMKDSIEGLSEKGLLMFHAQLERAKKAVEKQYHNLMEQTIFSVSATTFKEVVKRNAWENVSTKFLELFPDQEGAIDGYERVYTELNRLTPKENEESIVIVMRFVEESIEEEGYYDIVGRKKGDMQSYALDFTPWEEWIGYVCDESSLQSHGDLEFISHCLWELTFDGFEQDQIQENLEEIKRRAEEIKSDHP